MNLPKIGIVIIGINVEKYIGGCIQSVFDSEYPKDLINIAYADGGSNDNSINIAKEYNNVRIIELNDSSPTPGKGRNAGWKNIDGDLIQFLDADTTMDPYWLKNALQYFSDDIVAVCGNREEKYPKKNVFHIIANMEWRYTYGECRYFGGDVIVKRNILKLTGGYNDLLIAGEDPELSYRIRHMKYKIVRIDKLMTTHDINMSTFNQYFKRAYRSGHAYAEVGLKLIKNKEKMWLRELLRVTLRSFAPIIGLIIGGIINKPLLGFIMGFCILFKPFASLKKLKAQYKESWLITIIYATHATFIVYPQLMGAIRFIIGKIFNKPLTNKGIVKGLLQEPRYR